VRAYDDAAALVRDPDVAAVAVLVPASAHTAVGLPALETGNDVLFEKPLALTLDDCDRLAEAAARAGSVAMVGFNLRWHRLVRRARAALGAQALGRIALVQTTFTAGSRLRAGAPEWRKRRALGGGVLVDQAVHHFDLWRFLLDREVDEVYAVTRDADEHATVTARLTGGVLVSGAFSDGLPPANEIRVVGTEGRLELSCYRFDGFDLTRGPRLAGAPRARLQRLARELHELPRAASAMRGGGDHRSSYAAEWRHFLRAVRERGAVGSTLLDGRRAVEIQLAVLESADTGRPVAVRSTSVEAATTASGAVRP
jgi:predicted dehydrogenase